MSEDDINVDNPPFSRPDTEEESIWANGTSSAGPMKRRASRDLQQGSQHGDSSSSNARKRHKEVSDDDRDGCSGPSKAAGPRDDDDLAVDGRALVQDLAQELQCGCCSELVYHPVVVSPCHHFFCGSCCTLWIRNGGTCCPGCRGISTFVTPSRPVQTMVDVLLRAAPWKARAERERLQADEVYKAGSTLRIPTPRDPSPDAGQNGEYARPCPHCLPGNPWGWQCPIPVPDPITNAEAAWRLDDGLPLGHAMCGNCENLLATGAPDTTKCDFCQVSFCGIGILGRCRALPVLGQHPQGMSDIGDLIQSSEVYDCFDQNAHEVDVLLDYMTSQRLRPVDIYREIVTHLQSQPRGFAPLIELDIFVDIHGVAAGPDPGLDAPRNRICRVCATEILLSGLREWWIRERQKGFLDENVLNRPDCSDGQMCAKQKDFAHAREFNHIIASPEAAPVLPPAPNPYNFRAQLAVVDAELRAAAIDAMVPVVPAAATEAAEEPPLLAESSSAPQSTLASV